MHKADSQAKIGNEIWEEQPSRQKVSLGRQRILRASFVRTEDMLERRSVLCDWTASPDEHSTAYPPLAPKGFGGREESEPVEPTPLTREMELEDAAQERKPLCSQTRRREQRAPPSRTNNRCVPPSRSH